MGDFEKYKDYPWRPEQCMAARAIHLMKKKLYPKCEGCGYSADRQKCAMDFGGSCPRHQQEDVMAFDAAIRSLERAADLGYRHDGSQPRWEVYMPLHLYNDFSDTELALLADLIDAGGKQKSRNTDHRFDSLSSKGAVHYWSQSVSWVEVTDRGRALHELFLSKAIDAKEEE